MRTGWCLTDTQMSTITATTTGPWTAARGCTTTPPSLPPAVSTSMESIQLERDVRQHSSRFVFSRESDSAITNVRLSL